MPCGMHWLRNMGDRKMKKNVQRVVLLAALSTLVKGAWAEDPVMPVPTAPASASVTAAFPPTQFPGADWRRGDPQQLGWSLAGLARVKEYADRIGSSSVMIIQHGVVVDAWGDVRRKTPLFSVRKSIMSALIGIAVERHQISLDATLAQLDINDNDPALTPVEQQATVRQLLEARSGVYHPTTYETPWMKKIKPERGSHAPGQFWVYNNWDFNTLGAIYQKATGTDIFEAVARDIAKPIGMQDYQPADGRYFSAQPASRYPAYPIRMSARDLGRFALLYLNDGVWDGRQIVPSEWVKESTHPYSDTPWGGYGYMWWTSAPASGKRGPGATILLDAYWADGHLGQYAIVVPSLDLVVINRVDPKAGKKRVGEQRKAKLLWLVESAAGATNLGPEPKLVALPPMAHELVPVSKGQSPRLTGGTAQSRS